ncbi:YwqI/YxiC family protein [Parageobacillus toebii]|uniref:YwqI/YxiC family protein n=1 Tax=Parageobacillus toebii TaxID=153151 RepID=UPI0028150396|nr:YwqI/YxiC family protein [Parageobacillus toebii]WMT18243.1 YwqI/YxiC family protein [Parageobacillus toebii]
MSNEIKIVYEKVESSIANMERSTQSLEPVFPSSLGGENVLDVVTKLNELMQELQQTFIAYKELLIKNEIDTRQSIQTMRYADEEVATGISRHHIKNEAGI